MIEVLDYLRDDDFLTWIISGGGVDFMRPRVDGTYDIPPSQVIGSQIDLAYEEGGIFHRQAGLHANNDKAIKPMESCARSAVLRSSPSAIPMVISRCSTMRPRDRDGGSVSSSITPTAGRTAAYDRKVRSAGWTAPWMRPRGAAGCWSI